MIIMSSHKIKRVFFTIIISTTIIAGCKTLSLQGEQVETTKHESDVEPCKKLGEVKAHPPFLGSNDAENTLRNKTAELGGDVVLITDMSVGSANGIAYDCGGKYE